MQCAQYDLTRSSSIFISYTLLPGNTTENILADKRIYIYIYIYIFLVEDIPLCLKYNDKIKLFICSV
jgi:hypothetical protein